MRAQSRASARRRRVIIWSCRNMRNSLETWMDVGIHSMLVVENFVSSLHSFTPAYVSPLIYVVVRFAIRGETLFRTAPIEDTISSFASGVSMFTRSRFNILFTVFGIIFSWILMQPWTASLIPDVANVANMAKQFEPLMYASENVIPRSRELAEASIAVQDLGESVRATNMSASTVIIDQLDDLGDSLKVLSEKITSFFTNVDGDMDS
jgi:hypothetical protein